MQTTANGCEMLDESRERLRAAISSIDNTLAQVKSRCQSSYECDDENNIGSDCKKSKASEVKCCQVDRANSNSAFVTTPHRLAPLLPEVTLQIASDNCHLSSSVIDDSCRWSNTPFVQQQEEQREQNNAHQTPSAEKSQEWKDQVEEEEEKCVTSDYTDKQFSANREKEFDHILQLLRARREMDLFLFYNTRSKQLSEHESKEFQKLSLVRLPSLTPLNTHHNIVLLPLYSNSDSRKDSFTKELLCHTSPIRSHGVLQELLSNSEENNKEENIGRENVKGEEAASSPEDSTILTHSLSPREVLRTAPMLQTEKQIIETENTFTNGNAFESNNLTPTYKEHIVPTSKTTTNSNIKEKSSVFLPDYFSSNLSSQLIGIHDHKNEVENQKEVINGSSSKLNMLDMNSAMNDENLLSETTNISATMSMKPNSELVHMKQYMQETENTTTINNNNSNYSNNNNDDDDIFEMEEQERRKEVQEVETPLSKPRNVIRVINYEENPSEGWYKPDSNSINKNNVTDLQLPNVTQNESDIMKKKKSNTNHSVNVVNVSDIATMESGTASTVVNKDKLHENEELKGARSNEHAHELNTPVSNESKSWENINDITELQDTLLEETHQYNVINNNNRPNIQTPDDIVSVLYENDEEVITNNNNDGREPYHKNNQNVILENDNRKYKEVRSEQVNNFLLQKEKENEETDKNAHRITSARSLTRSVYRASCPSPALELLYETEMETHEKLTSTSTTEQETSSTYNDKWKEITEEGKKEMENVNVYYARPNNESVYNSFTMPSMLPDLPVERAHIVQNNNENKTKENLVYTIIENENNNGQQFTNIATNNTVIEAPELVNKTTHEEEEEEEEHQVDKEVMTSIVSCDNTLNSEMIAKHIDEDEQEEELLLNNEADEFVAEEENKQALSLSSPESSSSSLINDKEEQLNKDNVIVKSTSRTRQHMINVKVAEAAQDHALSLLKSTGIRVTVHVYDKCIPALVQISQHNDDLLLYIQRVETIKPNDQVASSLQSTPHVPTSATNKEDDNKTLTKEATANASHLPFVQNTPITQRSSSYSLQKPRSLFPSALSLSSLPPPPISSTSLHPMPSIAIPYTTLIESIRERDRLQQTSTTQDNECNKDNDECHSTSNTDNSVFSSSEHLPAIQSTSSEQQQEQPKQQRSLITITHSPIMCHGSTLVTPLTSIEEVMPSSTHKPHKNTHKHNSHSKVVMSDDGNSNWCAPSCRTLFGKLQRHLRTPAHSRRHYSLWEDDTTPQLQPSPSLPQIKSDKLTPNLYINRQGPKEFSVAAHTSAYPLSLPQLHSQTTSSHPREQSTWSTHKQGTLPGYNISTTNISVRQTVKEVQHFPLMHVRVCLPFASYSTSHNDMSSIQRDIDSYDHEDYNNIAREGNVDSKGANKHLHLPFIVVTGLNALKLLRCHHCTIFADTHPVSSTHTTYLLYILFPHHQPTLSHLTNPNETVLLILECATRLDWITLLMAMQAAQRSMLQIHHAHLTSQSEAVSETSSTRSAERDFQIYNDQIISYGRALWWLASQRLHYLHATSQEHMLNITEKVQKIRNKNNNDNNDHNNITDIDRITGHKNKKTRRRATHQHHHVSNTNASTELLTSNNNNTTKKKKHSTSSSNSNNFSSSLTKLKELLQRKKHEEKVVVKEEYEKGDVYE